MNRECESREAEDIGAIPGDVVRQGLEMNPPENQWKCDGYRQQTSPHNQPVRCPTRLPALKNEMIESKFVGHARKPDRDVTREVLWAKENLPSTPPVES